MVDVDTAAEVEPGPLEKAVALARGEPDEPEPAPFDAPPAEPLAKATDGAAEQPPPAEAPAEPKPKRRTRRRKVEEPPTDRELAESPTGSV